MNERDDFPLGEDAEAEFYKHLERIKVLTLSKWEALFLSDTVTLLLEHEPEKGKLQIPARGIQSSASVSVPIEMISRIGLAVLLSTNPTNKTGMTEMPVTLSELYLLRECCQSFVTHGNEMVGYNLLRKIYKLLLEDELKERAMFDKLTADIDVNLDNIPRVDLAKEQKDADTTPKNDRRSD
tara:strand:+ start:305 stop:850 length:546 start_codon:yes stop_codon:yes gene_type:complete